MAKVTSSSGDSTSRWGARQLYTALIGRKTRAGERLEDERFDEVRYQLQERLTKDLGGNTIVRLKEATAQTANWGKEDTLLVLVIAENQQLADETFDQLAAEDGVLSRLDQDEIWILRQSLDLFVARWSR